MRSVAWIRFCNFWRRLFGRKQVALFIAEPPIFIPLPPNHNCIMPILFKRES